ncbi:MAG: cation diffusion facilitator family transporter [Alteraurantiacibacter sp.]
MTNRAALTRSAAFASIAVALVLVALKSWASWRTGSTAMLGSLADSALDLVASLATLVGVWVAAQPADSNHRFGHGKAEAVAALVQVVLIALSAFGIAVRSVGQLLEGARIAAPDEGIGVSAIAIVLTLALLGWQHHVLNRTGSVAIATDHLHYKSDLALNLAVIAALALDAYAGLGWADPVFGLIIAGWLAWGARKASSEVVSQLMDEEWPEDKRLAFVAAAAEHPELSNLHDLRTRTSGHRDFVQFHVDMPGGMSVQQAHDVLERVEDDLCRRFPDTELLIHIDPEGHVDEPGNPLVEADEFERLKDQP